MYALDGYVIIVVNSIDTENLVMRSPEPIKVIDLFPGLQDELLRLLSALSPEDWERPTSNPKWNVKDISISFDMG